MPQANNLYEILGVPPSAPENDLINAYRIAERRFSPEVNAHPGAARQFEQIKAAYDVLTDPIKRAAFDKERMNAGAEKPSFTIRATPSKRVLRVIDEAQVLYLLIELIPEQAKNAESRESNLNLTIVLDHSTSMNGIRLERTRAAAYQIIDQLTPKDILSVVTFSDRADVLYAANPVTDKPTIRAMVATMQAGGGTEIFQGLDAGFKENQRYAGRKFINHIILLTDGKTYGDEENCLKLADKAAKQGIGISAMGLGDEWNDEFLDQLAGRTGGVSQYISSPNAVVRFLNDCVRALGRSIAERVTISVAPDPDVMLESAFRLTPSSQPLSILTDPIPLGQVHVAGTSSVLFQLQVPPNQKPGFRSIMRVCVSADIVRDQRPDYMLIADTSVEFAESPASDEQPPMAIMDALSKLSLYRLQEKASAAVARGDVQEATKRLETLATRLLGAGESELADAAKAEAARVARTKALSAEGQKALKYGTRSLVTGMVQTKSTPDESNVPKTRKITE